MGVVGGGVSLTYCWSYHCVDITCYPVAQPYLHQLGKWKLHYRSNSLQRDHLCRTTIVRLSPGRVLLYSSLLTSQCPTYPWDVGSVGPPGPDLLQCTMVAWCHVRSDGDWAGCYCTNLGTLGSLVKLTSQEIELFHSSFPEYTRHSHGAGHPFLGVLNKRMLNSDLVKSQTSHREVETHTGNTFPSLCLSVSLLSGISRSESHLLTHSDHCSGTNK